MTTQDDRNIGIDTPLGKDVLLLEGFRLREAINRPFLIEADLRSEQSDIDPARLPGISVTIRVERPAGGQRYLNGVVRTFERATTRAGLSTYRAEIVPWFSLLEYSTDCRIFQSATVPDILKQIFSDAGHADYRMQLTASYPVRGICTQYRETHFAFCRRLMEAEGISFHFEHEDGKHTMVLTDHPTAFRSDPAYTKIPLLPQEEGHEAAERLTTWSELAGLSTTSFVLTDYDYTAPRTDLTSSALVPPGGPASLGEDFQNAEGYFTHEDGSFYARLRAEAAACRQMEYAAEARCVGLECGRVFTMDGSAAAADDVTCLVTELELSMRASDFRSESGPAGGFDADCKLKAIPSQTQLRPELLTPRPRIAGLQTATVTGPQGGDPKVPYVTRLGSIKVKFRWDRRAGEDDRSSGWIRVSQILAGNQYGAVFLPRVGNEVVVAFEEGDPDRPLVVGSVYNGVMLPALPLPHFSQRCYFRDDGGNALCFTPEQGTESIVMYSPYCDTMRVVGAADQAAYDQVPNQPGFP